MILGERLREIREQKDLSQGDIEKRSGLRRSYISRVENGYTIPSIETLEKIAAALEVPMYQFFYDGEKPPEAAPKVASETGNPWGNQEEDAQLLSRLQKFLGAMDERQRKVLLAMATKMTQGSKRPRKEKADPAAAATGSG